MQEAFACVRRRFEVTVVLWILRRGCRYHFRSMDPCHMGSRNPSVTRYCTIFLRIKF